MPTSRQTKRRRARLYETQRGLCCLCGKPMLPVSPSINHPHDIFGKDALYPTFEHVVARQDGGGNFKEDNIKLAHLICNWARHSSDKNIGEQRRRHWFVRAFHDIHGNEGMDAIWDTLRQKFPENQNLFSGSRTSKREHLIQAMPLLCGNDTVAAIWARAKADHPNDPCWADDEDYSPPSSLFSEAGISLVTWVFQSNADLDPTGNEADPRG